MVSLCVLARIIVAALGTLAKQVMHHLSQSQSTVIDGYNDLVMRECVRKGMSRIISVSPNGPLLIAVMTPLVMGERN